MFKAFVFIVFVLLTSVMPAHASELEVVATVDRTQMQLGDTLHLSISVSGVASPQLQTSINDMSQQIQRQSQNLEVLNQWQSTQSSHVYSNGKMKTQHTKLFNFMLKPKGLGAVSIQPIQIASEQKTYATEAISVQVQKQSASVPPSPGGRPGQQGSRLQRPGVQWNFPQLPGFGQLDDFDDLFSNFMRPFVPRPEKPLTEEERKNLFFIRLEVDKARAYVGEQITATWSLYTKTGVKDIDTLKYPSLKGFWKEDLFLATRLNFTRKSHKGLSFRAARLASFALFALNKGPAVIDAYRAKLTLRPPHRWARSFEVTNQSVEKKVSILALPDEGRPLYFTGGVGEFRVSRRVDKQIQQGQPFALNIRIEGRGNAKSIEEPQVKWPSSLELYDTKSTAQFFKTGRSHKEFEILLVPNRAGRIEVPEMQFAFFNPRSEQYETQNLGALTLDVKADTSASVMASYRSFLGGGRSVPVAPELLVAWQRPFYVSALGWWGAFSFIFCLFLGQVYWNFKRTRKSRWQRELALKKQKLQFLLQQKKWKSLGVEAANALSFVVGHMAHTNNSSRWQSHYASTQPISQMLQSVSPSFRRTWGDKILNLSHNFEQLAFAPSSTAQSLHDAQALGPHVQTLCQLLDLCLEVD